MEKINHRLQQLLNSYLLESINETEKSELSDYLSNPIYEGQIKDLISDSFANQSEGLELEETKQQELLQYIYAHDQNVNNKIVKKKLWPRMVAAASIVLVAGVGFYFYKSNSQVEQQPVYVNDVNPGKNGATLTLANGQKILISEANTGNIASQSGIKISKTADGQIIYEISGANSGTLEYNTLSTTRGEQTKVRLPDGSLVFLNAASSLKYPASFASLKERKVELSGEGYFEISKDKAHPFIVKTAKQEIEVLGTQFNVNAYADEPVIKTTLLEGSIKLNTGSQKEILKPNEQAILRDNRLNIKEVETEEIVAWKNNEFLFRDDDFRTNMRKIARWYNVEIIYEVDAPDNFKLGGFLSRTKNLSAILKLMEKTDKVHFKISGKKVYVSK
ncbi:FecR family protein [Pedobacter sp. Hv1]|uniref:FecR family protein n=1 Tax=Pedobacter sp. Hv1 TaxID=1740090 RepID=UPI0006D898E6|nr:FecR family protein [Pedobacter sp. Hv1]KQC02048.1 hypothetical protein AQF98_00300 [Pedobacter sp. Hv1]